MSYDVLISGYGPVGATAAALLSRQGLRVGVVEQSAAIYDKPRAISLDHEVMRIFQACGVAHDLASFITPHTGTDFLGTDGEIIKRFDPMPPPYPLGWWPSIVFVQPKLETALRACVARNGAEVMLQTQVTSFAQDADGVDVSVRDGSGERVLRGKYFLACDGANSFVRRSLDIGVDDLAFDEWWMVIDTRQKKPTALPKKSTQYCRPERPSTFVMGPEDLRRWEIKLLPGEDPEAFGKPDNVAKLLAPHVDLTAVEIWRTAVYRFHALTAQRWRDRRIFLLGDACHQMPPFLGQGLCAGVRDVGNLAWKLMLALKGGTRDALLDSYETERKPHVRTIVEHAKTFGEIVGELDPQKARERDIRMREQIARGEAETVRQRFIPGLTAGVIDRERDGGTLFVQPRVKTASGEVKLLDDVLPPRFLVASRDAEAQTWLDQTSQAIWERLAGVRAVITDTDSRHSPDKTQLFVEQDGLFTAWMRERSAAAVIVRPDRYAYATVRNPDELNSAIQRLGAEVFA